MEPRYDIVLFGATSFVGKILTRRMAERHGFGASDKSEVRWAIAGRSKAKLDSLKDELGPAAVDLPMVIADAADEDSLAAMCDQTRVVVSTVGPYALYGEALVRACVDSGTDYCDLTGEVQWIRRMIQLYEGRAKTSGARIVHCCGFDSIPSDMGVWYLQQESIARFGQPCEQVKMRVKAAKGGLSGGTVASLMNVVQEAASNKALRKELADPFSICPPDHGSVRRQHSVKSAEFDKDLESWVAPFLMAAINTRVVHRSNALQDAPYGTEFQYEEATMTGRGWKGRARALAMAGAMGGFTLATAVKPTRWALERFVLPEPGEGPDEKAQEKGFYDLRFIGTTEGGQTITTKVTGQGDPGYGSTSRMLAQAAECLAFDIPDDAEGGFWTPASLLDGKLLERLQANARVTFEVLSVG
ncbi:saccharopine dehydrogenase family protein [Marinobacter zhanjiangensis]|uniref:Saccharopine dehydrogenase n=1 Tax=Marinobacter zhanjiangensis TaxID=578215 RepID=A0ABQ3B670_9GAMM|nr:saccharopine dehydrogenase NADP-binding domain-containing protein [Marinobacter zhanjiangensis]GGY81711.1 saccharopine dehydrogenase [Marinobacter zhanjiangensis]